jgi:hypothetical protein
MLHDAKPRTTWTVRTQKTPEPDVDPAVQGGVRLRELLALLAPSGGYCRRHVSLQGLVSVLAVHLLVKCGSGDKESDRL